MGCLADIMNYKAAKKVSSGNYVWLPDYKHNGRVTKIEADEEHRDIFFTCIVDVGDGKASRESIYHHTAVQPPKSTDEQAAFYLNDPDTKVYINYNNELGENEWLYSVVVADSGAFWLCSYDTEEEALAYIRENSLQMVQG